MYIQLGTKRRKELRGKVHTYFNIFTVFPLYGKTDYPTWNNVIEAFDSSLEHARFSELN